MYLQPSLNATIDFNNFLYIRWLVFFYLYVYVK